MSNSNRRPFDQTSVHVQNAVAGDADSLAWIAEHFAPLLRMHALQRMPPALREFCEPDDLIQEVWAVALPRLGSLRARDGRLTPVVVRFLATTLLRKINHAIRLMIRHRRSRGESSGSTAPGFAFSQVAAEITAVLSRVASNESARMLRDYVDRMETVDREIIVLMGIESLTSGEASAILGEAPSTLAMRYRRALDKLRARFADSVFGELS